MQWNAKMESLYTANAIKYIWKWKHKHMIEDLEKSKFYIDQLIDNIDDRKIMEEFKMTTYRIKISSKYFDDVKQKRKLFEVRKNDRPYKVKDTLWMEEVFDGTNIRTGNVITAIITYILDDPKYVKEGYVIMSIDVE